MHQNSAAIDVWPLLNRNLFFVKDAVKASEAKTSDKFDIYDPDTRELLFECREPDLSGLTKFRRFAGEKYDAGSPFNFVGKISGGGQQVFRITREVPFLTFRMPRIALFNHEDSPILTMKKKFFSFGPKFQLFTPEDSLLFMLRVKSSFGGYRLMAQNKELASLSFRWKGHQADYFKQGFKYAISITDEVPENSVARQLLIAFALSFHRAQI